MHTDFIQVHLLMNILHPSCLHWIAVGVHCGSRETCVWVSFTPEWRERRRGARGMGEDSSLVPGGIRMRIK